MLQRDDVDCRVETRVRKRERRQICNGVELPVIPLRVANSQVHSGVTLPLEMLGVAHLARARIQHTRAIRKVARKSSDRVFNGSFKVEHVPAQKCGKALLQLGMIQAFLRASTMIVDPQPHAASIMVNGIEASIIPK